MGLWTSFHEPVFALETAVLPMVLPIMFDFVTLCHKACHKTGSKFNLAKATSTVSI